MIYSNITIDIFMQNTKTQFELLFERLDSINSKITYLDHKFDRLDQDSTIHKSVQSSIKETFDKCVNDVSSLKEQFHLHDNITPTIFPHNRTVVIHNIPNINPKTIANHTRFILNNELSLSNIEVVKTKFVKT